MLRQINIIIKLRWTIFIRSLGQVPLVYKILMFLLIGGVVVFLSKVVLVLTWKSFVVALALHTFICSRIKYSGKKRFYLKQYKYLLPLSYFVDFVLMAIPFFITSIWLGLVTILSSALFAMYRSMPIRNKLSIPVLPSKFFVKSSYLWHAKSRYFLPISWVLIIILSIIAFIHQNFNLALVVFAGGSFFSFFVTVFQNESNEFIQVYVSPKHFIEQTVSETIINSVIFMLIPVMLLFGLFPHQAGVIVLVFISLLLATLNMVFVKYALFPSLPIALFVFVASLALVGALVVSVYGAVLIPFYYILIFYYYRRNIRKIICNNETNCN